MSTTRRLSDAQRRALAGAVYLERIGLDPWVTAPMIQTCEALVRRGLARRYWVTDPAVGATYYRLTDYGRRVISTVAS